MTNLPDKPQPGKFNACCAPCLCCVHHKCSSLSMEPEVGSAPNRCTSTAKEADSGSSSKRSDAFNSKTLAEKRNSSECHNNDVLGISGVQGSFNVAVRKKRGRRAPPSSRCLLGKKGDEVIGSDEVVNNYNHATEEGQAGKSQSILDLLKTGKSGNSSDDTSSPLSRKTEEQDQSINSKELLGKSCPETTGTVVESSNFNAKSFWAEKGSDERSQQDPFRLKLDGVDGEPTCQTVLANEVRGKSNLLENASTMQAAAMKKTTAENKTSQAIMDDVSDAQMNTTPAEDKSTEEVEDVKVCDICGDVGEEEKLAVCSRCGDGAEHIYCMRVMMQEVPEGEWCCEECHTEVEFETERLEKSEVKVGTLKEKSLEGKTNTPVNAAKSRRSCENEEEAENVGNKESNKANQCTDMVYRTDVDAGIPSVVRQHVPKPGGLSLGPDSRKRVLLSRESSFKLDVEKGKQPTHQLSTLSASNFGKNQAPPLHDHLPKSTSFNNSKVSKVKQLVNEVPQKPKILKDPLSCIVKKEGPIGFSTKSASFKKPKSCEPANNGRSSSILPLAEEPRVMNSQLSRNVNNDRATSILGFPSVTRSMALNMADSNKLGVAHEQGARNSLGNNEHMIPLLAKPSITSTSAERSSGILGSGAEGTVIQNSDALSQDDKIKDPPSLRPGLSSSSRTNRCQRCNEAGHTAQFCAIDKLCLSAIKLSSERNLTETAAKRNKTSEATQKATSRPVDQSEHILKCGPYHNPVFGPKDMLPTSFNHLQEPSKLYRGADEQDLRNSLSTPISTAFTDCSKLKFKERHIMLSAIGSNDGGSSMSSDLMGKSSQAFSPGDETIVSTVPELDYIWQGDFELWRTGRSPVLCDGFQAHLSCSASTEVLEVAKKFPLKVQLEELPRQNSWPTQFQENEPTYDNIGVFFFARDTQSYENHYSKLVQNMLNNDLALRGNIETAELLIFPSNILSKNIQRWNMFYFLWGIFRVKRNDHLNLPPDVPISNSQTNLNKVPPAMDLSTSVLLSSHSFSEDENNSSKFDHKSVKPATCADSRSLNSSEANHQGYLNGGKFLDRPVGKRDLDHHHHDSITTIFSTSNISSANDLSTAPTREHQKLASSDSQNKMWNSCSGYADEPIFDVNTAPATCSISSTHQEGNKSTTINLKNEDGLMDVDHVTCTEVNSGAMNPFLHVSGGSQKRNVDIANWTDGVNGILEHKKIKFDNVGCENSSLSENIRDGKVSPNVHPLAASSVDDGTDNEAVAVNSDSNEKCIFPLDLNVVDDTVTMNIVNILSSDDEDLPGRDELEPGDNKSPKKPLF